MRPNEYGHSILAALSREDRCRVAGCFLVCLLLGFSLPAGDAETVSEDFEGGLAKWELLEAANWELETADENTRLVLRKPGQQRPPVRRPGAYALLKGDAWRNVTVTARVKTLRPDRVKGRDVCILFGFVDDTHFYYAHICSDSNGKTHTVIMRVAGTKRTVIMNETRPPASLTAAWHTVRVSHRSTGDIAVFVDDLETPVMTARDTSYPHGVVGVGTFDDPAMFDDVVVEGERVPRGSIIGE